jgi:hypothetical protein
MFAGVALKCEGTIVVCEVRKEKRHVLIAKAPEEDNGIPETNG